jgi:uncharacterized protein YigA (DUF484 family)
MDLGESSSDAYMEQGKKFFDGIRQVIEEIGLPEEEAVKACLCYVAAVKRKHGATVVDMKSFLEEALRNYAVLLQIRASEDKEKYNGSVEILEC